MSFSCPNPSVNAEWYEKNPIGSRILTTDMYFPDQYRWSIIVWIYTYHMPPDHIETLLQWHLQSYNVHAAEFTTSVTDQRYSIQN